jgi:trimethylamine--corrinoid protein Co-methyltransferase
MLGALGMINDGPSFIIGAGLLGSYMGGSLAKMILDVELIAMARRYLAPIRTDREALAVDVIHDVGPGNHFIEHEHTLDNYRSEFLTESLFRSPDYERWAASGRRVVSHLAHERALKLLESYERPNMDQGLEEEIDAYVERNWVRK